MRSTKPFSTSRPQSPVTGHRAHIGLTSRSSCPPPACAAPRHIGAVVDYRKAASFYLRTTGRIQPPYTWRHDVVPV